MKRIIIAMLMVFGLGTVAYAGDSIHGKANIPFQFSVGDAKIAAAGVYNVTITDRFIWLDGAGRMLSSVSMVDAGAGTATSTALVFHRYGNKYFLSEVRKGERSVEKLPMSASEKRARDLSRELEIAEVRID